jgi:hypothetical protein
MHQIGYYAVAFVGGMVAGYAFRGRENYMIRLTVNDAIAAWTKAQQDAQKLYQDLQSGAAGVMKKL